MKLLILVVVVGMMAPLGACDQSIPVPGPTTRSAVVAKLPPTPSLVTRPYKRMFDDGALTVQGLMRARDAWLGDPVRVRGRVESLVQCATPPAVELSEDELNERKRKLKRGEEVAPILPPTPPRTCDPPPHALLSDLDARGAGAEKWRLLVYGSMRSAMKDLVLGETVTVEGPFAIVSKDGVFLRQAGLIDLPDLPVVEEQGGVGAETAEPTE